MSCRKDPEGQECIPNPLKQTESGGLVVWWCRSVGLPIPLKTYKQTLADAFGTLHSCCLHMQSTPYQLELKGNTTKASAFNGFATFTITVL